MAVLYDWKTAKLLLCPHLNCRSKGQIFITFYSNLTPIEATIHFKHLDDPVLKFERKIGFQQKNPIKYKIIIHIIFLFPVVLRPNAAHSLLVLEISMTHNDAAQSVGLLWMSDQPEAEISNFHNTTLRTDRQTSMTLAGNNLINFT